MISLLLAAFQVVLNFPPNQMARSQPGRGGDYEAFLWPSRTPPTAMSFVSASGPRPIGSLFHLELVHVASCPRKPD